MRPMTMKTTMAMAKKKKIITKMTTKTTNMTTTTMKMTMKMRMKLEMKRRKPAAKREKCACGEEGVIDNNVLLCTKEVKYLIRKSLIEKRETVVFFF